MPLDIKPTDWRKAKSAVLAYGKARNVFRMKQECLQRSGLLNGNDNKVGVAGEFWAKVLYHRLGYRLTSIEPSNNKDFDFCCRHDRRELKISVKVISDESKAGKQMRLHTSAEWDELLVLLLTEELKPYRYGRVTQEQFQQAKKDEAICEQPKVSRSWLEHKGWITRYGKVQNWD